MTDDHEYEVRIVYYGGLMVTSEQIKMIRFDIEMKEHYRKQEEEHELRMFFLKKIRWMKLSC